MQLGTRLFFVFGAGCRKQETVSSCAAAAAVPRRRSHLGAHLCKMS